MIEFVIHIFTLSVPMWMLPLAAIVGIVYGKAV